MTAHWAAGQGNGRRSTVIDFCAPPREQGRGHPRSATVRVLATLQQFVREGTPWRSLRATADKASGSTLRRHLEQWAQIGLLLQVHAVLVGMLRGDPTLILDTCSVRAKRGGDLTGPILRIEASGAPSITSRPPATASPSPARPRRRTSTTPWFSSGCSWPPSASWPGSKPCLRTRATTPSTIASCAARSKLSLISTNAVSRMDRGWASGAGRSSAPTPGSWRISASHSAMTGSASSSSLCSRSPASFWLQGASLVNGENRI